MAYILYSKFMLTTETDLTCGENMVAEYDHVKVNLNSIDENKTTNVSFLKFSSYLVFGAYYNFALKKSNSRN